MKEFKFKSQKTPLVSILMNCFNGEKFLSESIDSIVAQTYQNWELIFWDNQSTDSSKEIFESYNDSRLKYFLAPKHTDLGGGRSAAYEYLNGDFIAVLDVDDLWLPMKLEKQLSLFDDPEVGIVISDTMFFNELDERALYDGKFPKEGFVFKNLLKNYFVSLETLMLRKSILDKLNYGFDADFSFIADFDIVLRTAKISKLAIYKEVLAKWRVHDESDSWKSSISFCIERESWIKKQMKTNPGLLEDCNNEISHLHSKNFLLMAIYSLAKNERIKAFRFILRANFKNVYDYLVLILCFIPLSNKIVQYLQKQRIKRLLK